MKRKHIIIDTDGGFDDLLAIKLATLSDGISIGSIVTSYGNFSQRIVYSNIIKLIEAEGLQIDASLVVHGSSFPLNKRRPAISQIHGSQNPLLFNLEYFFSRFFSNGNVAQIFSGRQKYSYISLGPLTNLAKIINEGQQDRIKTAYILGGALEYPGNATCLAEANFFWDPEAVKIVLRSKIDIKLIPLNISQQIQLSEAKFKQLKPLSNKKFTNMFARYKNFYLNEKKVFFNPESKKLIRFEGPAIHDVLPVLATIDDSFLTFTKKSICLAHLSKDLGFVHTSFKNTSVLNSSPILVASEIDIARFWQIFGELVE